MKCAYHPEADAVGICVSCGLPVCSVCRTSVKEKTFCQPCAQKSSQRTAGGPSGKLIAGGVLGVVAGTFAISAGAGLIHEGFQKDIWWESTNWTQVGWGITLIVLGIAAIIGSSFALARKYFGLAITGAICALFPVWPLGVIALVLIILSREEFGFVDSFETEYARQPLDPFNQRDKLF